MSKVVLSPVSNPENQQSLVNTLNNNSNALTVALDNTLSRDGTSPNQMQADFDMNGNSILNLPDPTTSQEPITKSYGDANYGDSLGNANIAVAAAVTASAAAVSATASAVLAAATVGDSYTFLSATTSSDPGSGQFKLNAAPASATSLYISETDGNANNLAAWLAAWTASTNTNKAVVTIEKTSSPNTIWAMFRVTARTDNGTWDTFTLTYITGSGSFTNNDICTISADLTGDKGVDGAGTGDVVGPASSVDSEIALFSSTTGKLIKRGTGSGYVKVSSGVLQTPSASVPSTDVSGLATSATTDTTNASNISSGTLAAARGGAGTINGILKANGSGVVSLAVGGTDYQAADAQLFSNIPQNSQSAAYTLLATDAQKHIYHPSADTTARIWTIPANASVAFAIGTVVTFVNDTSGGVITISITTDTLVLAGAGTTGSRTLAANGVATAIKVTSTRWVISGTGLT